MKIKTGQGLYKYTSKKRLGYIRRFKDYNRSDKIQNIKLSYPNQFAYNHLAKNIVFTAGYTGKNIIAVSSVNKNEGKSTTSSLLGLHLAKSGFTVLLIDSDLRNPSLHKLFNLDNNKGYSDFCAHSRKLNDCIRYNVISNLDVLTGGYAPPNVDELLSQKSVVEEISELSKEYDYIIIDLPPFRVCKDVVYYKNIIAGLMIVIKYKSTKYFEIFRFMKWIKKNNIHFLGFVFNQVEHSKKKQTK